MSDEFESPVFGRTRRPTEDEGAAIKKAVDETPVAVFQAINKALNAKGLCLSISTIEEGRQH